MGGKSFAKPASRLTTSELDKLTLYCQNQLAFVFPRTERLRCITTKDSHGDLDLLCAFDEPDIRIGQSQVGLSSDDEEEVGGQEVDRDGGKESGKAEERKGNITRLRRFCDDVSAVLGANGWVIAYYGYPIIALQLPFKQIDPITKVEESAFWQVDVALVHPDSYDAYLFSCSYNIPFALLVLATQALSPSFWLKRDGLCLRHRPFLGQPIVEITLIEDREELYRWLGLDMAIWEAGYDTYEDIYRWITTNPPGSALAEAWKRVAAGWMDEVKVEYKRLHTRVDGVPEFIAWLKANRGYGKDMAVRPAASPVSASSASSASAAVCEIPLDDIVRQLLVKAGRLSEYEDAIKPLKIEAERVVMLHEKKKANRERARLDEERGRAQRAALAIEEAAARARELEAGGLGDKASGADKGEQGGGEKSELGQGERSEGEVAKEDEHKAPG